MSLPLRRVVFLQLSYTPLLITPQAIHYKLKSLILRNAYHPILRLLISLVHNERRLNSSCTCLLSDLPLISVGDYDYDLTLHYVNCCKDWKSQRKGNNSKEHHWHGLKIVSCCSFLQQNKLHSNSTSTIRNNFLLTQPFARPWRASRDLP